MGGPCLSAGKTVKPGTDNFELKPFTMNDVQYWSSEHAYQALKMKNLADRTNIIKLVPRKGEKAWDHGMRVWQKGQQGKARSDWEAVKIEAMYLANKCKIEHNPDCLEALLATTGPFTHSGSGAFWDYWNPVLLEVIREELRSDGDAARVASLWAEMEAYRKKKGRERSFLEDVVAAPEESADADGSAVGKSPAALLQAFQNWDANGDGTIDRQELMAAMVEVGLAEDKLPGLFEAADLDKDGKISYEEFSLWICASAPAPLRDAV